MSWRKTALAALALAGPGCASAQEVISGTGIPVNFPVVGSYTANSGSSLLRRWIVMNSAELGVTIDATDFQGLTTYYVDRDFPHALHLKVNILEPVQALSVVVLPFNVWGEPGGWLQLNEIKDLPIGIAPLEGEWRRRNEAEAGEVLTALILVDKVRMANGTVRRADRGRVINMLASVASDLKAPAEALSTEK